jgi:hypothetical protein
MIEALRLDEIEIGQGLNQEMGLARPGDTRWGSHYITVMHVMHLYSLIRKVLLRIGNESKDTKANGTQTMLKVFESFEFVFLLHLLNEIFGYTNDLCIALQKREQGPARLLSSLSSARKPPELLRRAIADCLSPPALHTHSLAATAASACEEVHGMEAEQKQGPAPPSPLPLLPLLRRPCYSLLPLSLNQLSWHYKKLFNL